MVTYKVTVHTHRQIIAEKTNSIYLTLIDSKNQSSERVLVNKSYLDVSLASEREFSFDVSVKKDLGDIVLVQLEKTCYVNYHWFCKYIIVKTPSGECLKFPCYSWIEDEKLRIFREGTARLAQDDSEFLKKKRREQLEYKQREFSWDEKNTTEGYPKSMGKVPRKIEFDAAKKWEFDNNFIKVGLENGLDRVRGFFKSWKDVADFKDVLASYNDKDTLEKVMRDWSEDYMFGYQFLNGCNPVMISKCIEIPAKFPVTHEMVKGSLEKGVTLQEELKAGNIYIVDYEILKAVEKLKPNHYLTAPLCLLYKNRLDQMVPIAIQLSQTPGEESPIFLPSDNEHDWMLAKMWVKSADFLVHQLVTHLLKTHLMSEVFEIAMHRQLPPVHPVYKLLQPHVRFTTAINALAREKLISEGGVITQITSLNRAGIDRVIVSAMETLTYESLCFPEAIEARGMKDVPKYYYRDDGMKIWEAILNFVFAVVEIYYDSDEKVQGDEEIQGFVKDCHIGMQRPHSENRFNFSKAMFTPVSLNTREELVKYLTVVIFTASAQHAAVNFGQFDWYGWIPNSPSTMRKPPPKQKGKVDMKFIMESLPDRGCSRTVIGTVWGLSRFQEEERYLGDYPDMGFTEKPVKEAIKTFRKKLGEVAKEIKSRNQGLRLEYCYLSPDRIPNSVAI